MCDRRKLIDNLNLPRRMDVTGFGRDRVRFTLATVRAIWGGNYDWIVIGTRQFVGSGLRRR